MRVCDRCGSSHEVHRVMVSQTNNMALFMNEYRDLCDFCEKVVRTVFKETLPKEASK